MAPSSSPGSGARRSHVNLSPKGRRLFAEIHDRSHEFERSLSSVIDAEEMATAMSVLVKLRTFVEGLSRDPREVEP